MTEWAELHQAPAVVGVPAKCRNGRSLLLLHLYIKYITLVPAYNEFGLKEHPAITSRFFASISLTVLQNNSTTTRPHLGRAASFAFFLLVTRTQCIFGLCVHVFYWGVFI